MDGLYKKSISRKELQTIMKFPCRQCLKRPICKNLERIKCSDLFFIILDNADFDRGNKIVNEDIKSELKKILHVVTHILPGPDWKERLHNGDTLQDVRRASSMQRKKTH